MGFSDGSDGIEGVLRAVLMMISDECKGPITALASPLTLVFKDPKQEAFFNERIMPKLMALAKVKEVLGTGARSWEMGVSSLNDKNTIPLLIGMIILKSGGDAIRIDPAFHAKRETESNAGGLSSEEIMRLADIEDLITKVQ